MSDLAQKKEELRAIFKSKRAALSPQDVMEKSQQINRNFIKHLLPKIYRKTSNEVFSLYLASYSEVSTNLIAQHFFNNNIKFSYPKIVARKRHLDFVEAFINQEFEPNIIFPKILEPKNIGNNTIFPNFIILPLLAFDHNLSRLGLGGGFFDMTIEFLKKQNSQIITIGLAYDFQRSDDTLPIENTDQRLDFIVTEKNIFSAS